MAACGGGGDGNGSGVVAPSAGGNTYTVGGKVTGLVGGGLTLSNNGGDDLSIDTNGAFTFQIPMGGGDAYSVTILTMSS